jgi:hypothetical protein
LATPLRAEGELLDVGTFGLASVRRAAGYAGVSA